MHATKAAQRYAKALLGVADETDSVESVLEDVNLINNTLEGSRDLVMFLRSPIVKYDDKSAVLEEIFEGKVQEVTSRFLKLLARKSRIYLLDQVVRAFIQQYNEYANILEVDLHTARELTDTQQGELQKALEEKTGKEIDMTIILDESLMGGVAVRIGDTVIDGTIKHMLEELEQKFVATAIE